MSRPYKGELPILDFNDPEFPSRSRMLLSKMIPFVTRNNPSVAELRRMWSPGSLLTANTVLHHAGMAYLYAHSIQFVTNATRVMEHKWGNQTKRNKMPIRDLVDSLLQRLHGMELQVCNSSGGCVSAESANETVTEAASDNRSERRRARVDRAFAELWRRIKIPLQEDTRSKVSSSANSMFRYSAIDILRDAKVRAAQVDLLRDTLRANGTRDKPVAIAAAMCPARTTR